MALLRVEAFFRFPPAHLCLLAVVRWLGGFAFTLPRFAPWPGEPGRVVTAHLAQGPGRRMPGAVPVAGAGHMRTDAEMSAGAASLATLTGRAAMGWRWVSGCAHVCTGWVLTGGPRLRALLGCPPG